MRLETLMQFLLPLTFLAIWALTSLFNRESAPLPPRQGRPFGPDGLRPGDRAALARGGARPPEARPNPTPGRWTPPTALDRPAPRRLANDRDDILIIEAEPRRPTPATSAPPRIAASAVARKPPRPRAATPAAPKPAETASQHVLGGSLRAEKSVPLMTTALQGLGKSPEPLIPLESREARKPAPPPIVQVIPTGGPFSPFKIAEIGPEKLREAILLNEILLPPLGMRPNRFRASVRIPRRPANGPPV